MRRRLDRAGVVSRPSGESRAKLAFRSYKPLRACLAERSRGRFYAGCVSGTTRPTMDKHLPMRSAAIRSWRLGREFGLASGPARRALLHEGPDAFMEIGAAVGISVKQHQTRQERCDQWRSYGATIKADHNGVYSW